MSKRQCSSFNAGARRLLDVKDYNWIMKCRLKWCVMSGHRRQTSHQVPTYLLVCVIQTHIYVVDFSRRIRLSLRLCSAVADLMLLSVCLAPSAVKCYKQTSFAITVSQSIDKKSFFLSLFVRLPFFILFTPPHKN